MGINPSNVANDVINTGRRRWRDAVATALVETLIMRCMSNESASLSSRLRLTLLGCSFS